MAARLRRREAYFRSLVRSSGDAVVILDDQLRITGATAALERSLGAGATGLVGRPLLDVVHPEDRPGLAAALPGRARPPSADAAAASRGLRAAAPPAARTATASGAPSRPASPTCARTPTSARSCCTAAT